MKRRISGLSVLALAAMLGFGSAGAVLAQGSQHAVTGEVNVGKGGQSTPAGHASPGATSTPGAASTSAAAPSGPPQNRVLKRNPFVPPSGASALANSIAAKAKQKANDKTASKNTKTKTAGVKAPGAEATAASVAPPPFTLAGIVSGGGELKALLITGKGNTEARVGDSVDGYKVTSINLKTREVVVQMSDHAFKVQLPQDTPYGQGKGPGGAPAAPAANGPLPPPPAPAPAGAPGKAHPKGGR